MPGRPVTFNGITPYLHYDDIAAALEWLIRVFGFVEKGRWTDDSGHITNAEITIGPHRNLARRRSRLVEE